MSSESAIHPKERIKIIKSNFSLGVLLIGNLIDPQKKEGAVKDRVVVDGEGIHFITDGSSEYIKPDKKFFTFDIAGNPDLNADHAIAEFSRMLIRNTTIDAFGIFKNYCKNTDQVDTLKNQIWYVFAWLIGNCLTHDQKMIFNNYHKGFLPNSWNGNTIDVSLENKELPFTIFGYFQCCSLLEEMETFAQTLL